MYISFWIGFYFGFGGFFANASIIVNESILIIGDDLSGRSIQCIVTYYVDFQSEEDNDTNILATKNSNLKNKK